MIQNISFDVDYYSYTNVSKMRNQFIQEEGGYVSNQLKRR